MKLAAFLLAAATILNTSASSQFQLLTARMQHEVALKAWHAYRIDAGALANLLNRSPDALVEVARADARLGDTAGASQALQAYVAMGGASPTVAQLPEFATLPGISSFRADIAANARPAIAAMRAFALTDPGLLPENIDYDPLHRRFLITSIRRDEIVSADDRGHLTRFARAPDNWPMLALNVDAPRHLVWSTEVAIDGFAAVPKRDWGRSVVLAYDLRTGALAKRIEGPHGCAFNDLAVDATGNVLVTDASHGGIYQLRANGNALQAINTHDFISPLGSAYAPDGRVFIADYARGIGIMNADNTVRWIPMNDRYALAGIDGLYYVGGFLIAVQNGFVPERVIELVLGTDGDVTAEQTIESGTAQLDPTHGVMLGSAFYYLKNTGWNQLDAAGNVKSGARLTPAVVMRVGL
jgi:hypothetical protein